VKVLLLADDFGGATLDPAGLWLAEITRVCRGHGHRLEVVCSAAGASPGRTEPARGLVLHRADPSRVDPVIAEALAAGPDVVHVAAPGPFNARVIESLAEFPLMLELHDWWPICPQFDLLRRPGGHACDRHHPFEGCVTCTDPGRLASMADRGALVSSARLIVAHGETTRDRVAAALGRDVVRLGYGVDTLRFSTRPAPATIPAVTALAGRRTGARVLLLGPPTAARGGGRLVDLLVALAARVPEVELVIAGLDPDDPSRDTQLRDEARSLGLEDRLVMLPVVPPEELPALIHACDIGVAPGVAPDPGGLFLLLAFACGLPVVAHPGGDIVTLCDGHEGAILADAHDVGAFANAVALLLTDRAEHRRRSDAARLAAIERHDLERVVAGLESLWEDVTRMPARTRAA
jgi:glycosyltransferase involved in cell wall biosynthesis